MIKLANLVMAAGIVMCLFPFNNYFLAAGRLVWGIGAGSFSVFVPKFISEVSPREMSGFLGGANQFAVCFGILVPSLMALMLPSDIAAASNFYLEDYWRICWSISIAIALIQLVLLQTCFNFETPQTLKENSEWDRLTTVMR
jgi:MFS family permease